MHNASLQNKAGRSFLTTEFDLYLLQSQHNKKTKQNQFFKVIYFKMSLSYRHLTYRPRFDVAWNALCMACMTWIKQTSRFSV